MLPNVKKDLHTLKTDFDENGVNRITPKLLRDLLVSLFASRLPRKIVDSQDLNENDDLIIVEMDESGNYIKVPRRFDADTSGTPFVNQSYTIINVGSFPINVITETDDLFHDNSQLVKVGVGEIIELVATADYWVFYSGGSAVPNGGMVGFPVRLETNVLDGAFGSVDSIPVASARTIKWTISQKVGTLNRTSEVLVNVGQSSIDSCEFGILGDDIDADISVALVGTNVVLKVANHSGDVLNMIVLRVVLA